MKSYTPLFAISMEEEEEAKAVVKYLRESGGNGLQKILQETTDITVIHSWGNVFDVCTDAAWGLRKYPPSILVVYVSQEERERYKTARRQNYMEVCQTLVFPAICLYDKVDQTVLTCYADNVGTIHPTRYQIPESVFST